MNYSGWELNFFDRSNYFRKYQYNLIKKYLGKKILEVGPGSGEFANKYFINKKKLFLTELNTTLRNKLKKKFKNKLHIKILGKKINNIKNSFDTICYLDVIEHIKEDEIEIINALKKIKKNGHLVIIVPANQLLYSNYDKSIGHFRRYEKKYFINLTKKNNLNLIKLSYFDSIGFFFLIVNKILNPKKNNNLSIVTTIWNLLVPLSILIDKLTFNTFGKSLICVFKKR